MNAVGTTLPGGVRDANDVGTTCSASVCVITGVIDTLSDPRNMPTASVRETNDVGTNMNDVGTTLPEGVREINDVVRNMNDVGTNCNDSPRDWNDVVANAAAAVNDVMLQADDEKNTMQLYSFLSSLKKQN